MKTYFIFICKSEQGSIYASSIISEACSVQRHMADFSSLGIRVIDVKVINLDMSVYEH